MTVSPNGSTVRLSVIDLLTLVSLRCDPKDPRTRLRRDPDWVQTMTARIGTVTHCGETFMAKALLGHVGGPDPRVIAEMRRLQQRVRALEDELRDLRLANAELAELRAVMRNPDVISLDVPEPALT